MFESISCSQNDSEHEIKIKYWSWRTKENTRQVSSFEGKWGQINNKWQILKEGESGGKEKTKELNEEIKSRTRWRK